MTLRKILRSLTPLVAMMCAPLLTGCLGDGNESETIITDYSNATIKSLTMADNSSVCPSLSAYAFTVDNQGTSDPEAVAQWPGAGIIFNADSLPVGSVADSIKVSMTYSSPSSVWFYHYGADGALVDSVNFAQRQILYFAAHATTRIHVVAADGMTAKDYILKVNVHQTVGDTIEWQYVDRDVWAGADVAAQRAVAVGDTLLWYAAAADGSIGVRRTTLAAPLGDWSEPVAVAASLDLGTLYARASRAYAVATDGRLVTSADGLEWHDATSGSGVEAVAVVGTQLRAAADAADSLVVVVRADGVLRFAKLPFGEDGAAPAVGAVVPDGFPVAGFAAGISVEAHPERGNATSRLYIVGGRTADGRLTSSTWSCDGTSWVEFPQSSLPAMEGAAVVRYTTDTDYPGSLWLLWPGTTAAGPVSGVWFSENQGVAWRPLASEYAYMAALGPVEATASASAFVEPTTYWIYIVGGATADGQTTDVVGGQLRSLTFGKRR